jgi:hypothetical protein
VLLRLTPHPEQAIPVASDAFLMATYAHPTAPDAQPGPSSRPLHARPPSYTTNGTYVTPNLVPATFPPSAYSAPASASASTSVTPRRSGTIETDSTNGDGEDGKKKKAKRRKVNHACLYCRRSHMTCDEGRPCQRW